MQHSAFWLYSPVDSKKLAKKIADEEISKIKNKIIFAGNIENEDQKSGVGKDYLNDLYSYCRELNLDVGLMYTSNDKPDQYLQTKLLNKKLNLQELSMGMSSDYLKAIENSSTFLRIAQVSLAKGASKFLFLFLLIILSIIKNLFLNAIHPAVGLFFVKWIKIQLPLLGILLKLYLSELKDHIYYLSKKFFMVNVIININ